MDKVQITDNAITRREIRVVDENYYEIRFIIDEKNLTLTVQDDYLRGYSYRWTNIGNRSFLEFLSSLSLGYLESKLFSREDREIDIKKNKEEAKKLAVRYFEKGLSKERRGEILKEIDDWEGLTLEYWYAFITSLPGLDHSNIDFEGYPDYTKVNFKCQKILDTYEKYFKPYLKELLKDGN